MARLRKKLELCNFTGLSVWSYILLVCLCAALFSQASVASESLVDDKSTEEPLEDQESSKPEVEESTFSPFWNFTDNMGEYNDTETREIIKAICNGTIKDAQILAPVNKRSRKGPKRRRRKKRFSWEYYLKRDLLDGYDKTTRPVWNDSSTTVVYIAMSLYHILDTNEKFQTLSALIAVRVRWLDEYLAWDPAYYGGVDTIWIPAMHIWRPDIFINNFADDSFKDFMDTNAIISSNGQVLWLFPAVVKTYCTLDVQHFPFDRQTCGIAFISWTFNGFKVDITYNTTVKNVIYYNTKNQEWFVDRITADRHVKYYACCQEPYPDVTFTIHMRRRSLFYILNLIYPCLLIYAVSFLGFFLPVESGEKVNLEITILLALVVFLLIVGDLLPPVPDAIPALGMLFGMTMLMVSIALVMAVIVTNIYLRKESGKRVPFVLRKIFLRTGRHRSHVNNKINSENHVNENSKCADIEIDTLSIQSDAEVPMCRSKCRRNRSLRHRRDSYEANARTAQEWEMLARCVDRLFFWLFLVASAVALTMLFANIQQNNNRGYNKENGGLT